MSGEPDDIDAGSREHYADGALYDYEYRRRREDVGFYTGFARDVLGGPGRILELGAGSGRITLALAKAGHTVVAMDSSRPMLERLRARIPRAHADRVTTMEADLRSFTVPHRRGQARFPLAIAAFNVLEHLYTRTELAACLACVKRALTPDGIFAFDVQFPDLAWLNRDPDKKWARTKFTDPTTQRLTLYSTNHVYDPVSQIAVIRLYYEPVDGRGPDRVVRLSQRKYFPAELEALVSHAGFRVLDRFGDFFSSPLDGASPTQVLICQPIQKPRRKR